MPLALAKKLLFSILCGFLYSSTLLAGELKDSDIESIRSEDIFSFDKTKMITSRGVTYYLRELPRDEEVKSEFLTLSPESQEIFFKRRNSILQGIIEKIDREKSTKMLGRFTSIRGKVIKLKDKLFGKSTESTENKTEIIDYQEIGTKEIQNLVTKLEGELFKSARLIANQDVKGRSLALNIALGFGLKSFGALLNFSLGIGYFENIQTGQKYIELFLVSEKFKHALSFAAPVFTGAKVAWLTMRNDKLNETKGKTMGNSLTLPMAIPSIYRNQAELSISSSLGIDFLDIFIPMQTLAQSYNTTWKRWHYRIYLSTPRPTKTCLKKYTQNILGGG